MYLDDGLFANERFLVQGKVAEYAKCQFCEDSVPLNKEENRRGAGFDKPKIDGKGGTCYKGASMSSFGHSGFTGTLAWVDPVNEVNFVFLSNRVYPNAENWKLVKMNTRTEIQRVIYEAVRQAKR
jgi:CubicO group peptidase (beta-lactamase class C family)